MTTNFEQTERSIAVAPQDVATLFPQLLAQYGEELPDGTRIVLTIGGHWDDAAQTRLRAASLHKGTITGQPLTDGRVAFTCLWQADLAAAFDAGGIEGVEQLTEDQLAELTPEPEGMP
jgi:DNA-binding transcriptional LysR family regulator